MRCRSFRAPRVAGDLLLLGIDDGQRGPPGDASQAGTLAPAQGCRRWATTSHPNAPAARCRAAQ